MNKDLQDYLNAAKQQMPLIEVKDIEHLINAKSIVKKRFLNLKTIIFISTLSAVIIGIWLMWSTINDTNQIAYAPFQKQQIIQTKPQPNPAKVLDDKPASNPKNRKKTQQIIATTTNSINQTNQSINEIENWFKPKNDIIYPTPQNPTREYFNENGELILTHEELAKLGIITDGNVLNYKNIVDTVIRVSKSESNKPEVMGKLYFSLKIIESGGKHTTQGGSLPLIKLSENSLPFWCSFIVLKSDKDSSIIYTEFYFNRKISLDSFAKEVKPYFIPVRVQTHAKENRKYQTDNDLVFWFKCEQAFINVLPEEVKTKLQPRVDTTNIANYGKHIAGYKYNGTNKNLSVQLSTDKVTELKKRIIKLDKAGFNLLHLKVNKNKFTFKGIVSDNDIAHHIRFKYMQGTKSYAKTIQMVNIKHSDTLIKPIALTSKKLDVLRYFYIDNDDLSYNQSFQRNHERFLKEFDELIPVKVLPDLLMWFSPSDFVLDVISNHQVSDKFTLEKSRLVRLNEPELAKLNITYQNNGIKVPTYVNGPRNIYSIYNNKESISELNGFNYKPINSADSSVFNLDTTNRQVNINLGANLQITPVLITNADGITWRQYELETEKFMTEEELNFMNSHHPSPKDYQPYLIAKIKAKEALAAQINTLLPIAIKHPTIQNLGIIAWYKPDSNLINLLPANIAREIKREADIITNNKQGINCQYFETCDAVKILYEVNIHPNPVEQLFSIKIETGELRKFSIHITNIEGKIIKTITKGKMLHAGTHELPCNISDLAPGIYLLQVNTELDELIVKRLIKK